MAGPNTGAGVSHFSNVEVGGDLAVGDALTAVSLTTTGAVTADSVAATGAVTAATVAATGAISGASAALTGAVTAATATTTGNISAGADVIVGDDIVVPGLTGDTIKFGDATTSEEGWHDMLGYIESRGVGGTDPAWTQIAATEFWAYDFAINDKVWQVFHIPHDYVPGTDIYIHTHWIPDGTNTASVKWEYTYSYAHGHNQGNFNLTGTVITAEEAPPGTVYRHMVTESAAITIADMEVDGVIMVQVRRITNGGTDNTDEIFVLTSDIHYKSSGLPTPNRAPNFYNT